MFDTVVKLFIAASAVNADPIGPNACPTNITTYLSNPTTNWYGVTWTNGDATAYTYFSEDGGTSVSYQATPGRVSYDGLWTLAETQSGLIVMKHVKDGIDDSCGWQDIGEAV